MADGWFGADSSWDEKKQLGEDLFKRVDEELQKAPSDQRFFFDKDFTCDNNRCWYAGGSPDELGELYSADTPDDWVRLSQSSPGGCPIVFPQAQYSQLKQGGNTNGYFVEALQALAMRPALVKRLFVAQDPQAGVYVIRFFKNSQWVNVLIDDYVPMDKNKEFLCITCDNFPSVCWPALIEKAYAKLHHSYEAIGDGGSVISALMDLTGGLGGHFSARDVAPDRLFVYLYELQGEALFCARVDQRECARRGVRLADAPYVINRAAHHEGRCWLQLCSPNVVGGPFDDVVPYSLLHSAVYKERATEGCFWISVEDFQNYFSQIFECRLVTCGSLDSLKLINMPRSRVLAYQYLHEKMFAYRGNIRAETVPEFTMTVAAGQAPCEIYCCASQIDLRMMNQERLMQAPMLLTVHQFVSGGSSGVSGFAFVAKSNYLPERDASVIFKVLEPGEFLVLLQVPMGYEFDKMIFRTYATSEIHVQAKGQQGKHTRLIPTEPLMSTPMTLIGRGGDCTKHGPYDADDGMGHRRGIIDDHDGGGGCSVM